MKITPVCPPHRGIAPLATFIAHGGAGYFFLRSK